MGWGFGGIKWMGGDQGRSKALLFGRGVNGGIGSGAMLESDSWNVIGRVDFQCIENEIDLGSMSDLDKVAISAKDAPAAIGPYSQAVWVGDLLFASGQVALDPATGQLVAGGITEQTVRVLQNVKAVLNEAGLHLHNVVKTTVFLKSMSDFAAMNEVYGKHLAPEGVVAPARSTVAVAGLPKDALVEIEVIARDPKGRYGTA
jgi:2-iminobutanoate/2-iminopropanoate deaminase